MTRMRQRAAALALVIGCVLVPSAAGACEEELKTVGRAIESYFLINRALPKSLSDLHQGGQLTGLDQFTCASSKRTVSAASIDAESDFELRPGGGAKSPILVTRDRISPKLTLLADGTVVGGAPPPPLEGGSGSAGGGGSTGGGNTGSTGNAGSAGNAGSGSGGSSPPAGGGMGGTPPPPGAPAAPPSGGAMPGHAYGGGGGGGPVVGGRRVPQWAIAAIGGLGAGIVVLGLAIAVAMRSRSSHRAPAAVAPAAPPGAPRSLRLTISYSKGGQRSATLRLGSRATIGRARESDLVLEDETVSNHHAQLAVSGAELVLTDLASANGTRVNGRRITRATVVPGDVMTFGQVRAQIIDG